MKNKKTIVIGMLCAIVAVMAVGYAALATELNITGTASIDSTWKVEITNITERDIVGDAVNKTDPSYTATTANFSVGLTQPGDSITYDIEVTNNGTLDAVLESINVTTEDNNNTTGLKKAIKYTTEGLKKGDKLSKNGGKNTLTIKVEYNPDITSQPADTAGNLTVILNYQQDYLGPIVAYDYVIGDVVNFAGSNWYVIKNSTNEEDYVTLLKEKVLTSEELGEYAANYTITCSEHDAQYGNYGCTTKGEIIKELRDTIWYYWGDICCLGGFYGYTDYDTSGCEGHNDYEGSKVKEYLEGVYINTLGADNLKEIEGYKIRLIKLEELQNNLGYAKEITGTWYEYNTTDTPSWVYQNFGELSDHSNSLSGYWTMTPHPDSSVSVWGVSSSGRINIESNDSQYIGVRPVINLLKSSI